MGNSYTYQKSLNNIDDSVWPKLYFHEKLATLQAIEDEIAKRQGRPACTVTASSLVSNYFDLARGAFTKHPPEIHVNSNQLINNSTYGMNAKFHLTGVLHEGRHAYQNEVVNGNIMHNNRAEAEQWKANLKEGNYIKFSQNPQAYYYQPVEIDARIYAEKLVKQLQEERTVLNNSTNSYVSSKEVLINQISRYNAHIENTATTNKDEPANHRNENKVHKELKIQDRGR